MPFFNWLYENALFISVPCFILASTSLVHLIRDVIKIVREARLFSVSLAEIQEVEFAAEGRVVLCAEGPRFTTRFARLSYHLIGPDGNPVESRRSWFRSRTAGFSRVRMELRYFNIPMPGRYTLQMTGLDPGQRSDDHRIVFMSPHLARTIVRVVGIVFSGQVLIGSLVLLLMRLVRVAS